MTERIYTNISAISKFMSNDIPIGIKDYAVRKINELLNLIYDAMDADTELVTANKDNFILRCIADCVAYTIRDLHYTKIPIIHWDSIIEKMYLLVFDEIKKCSKKQYDSETTLAFINYSYNKAMQEILNEFVDENEESIQVLKQELIYQKISVMYFLYRDKNFEIPMQKGVCPIKGVEYTEEDKLMLGDTNYDMEGNVILSTELDDETKALIDYIQAEQINIQNKYESITKKGLELFNKNQTTKFIEFYNNELTSIAERMEALGVLLSDVLETENYDGEKVLKFRDSILKSKNNDFIYLFDDVIFQAGAISPEEFVQSIEDGMKKQIPMAYAIKSNFYKYGLEVFEPCHQAIKKAIMLAPNNLEYKKILKDLEQES